MTFGELLEKAQVRFEYNLWRGAHKSLKWGSDMTFGDLLEKAQVRFGYNNHICKALVAWERREGRRENGSRLVPFVRGKAKKSQEPQLSVWLHLQ